MTQSRLYNGSDGITQNTKFNQVTAEKARALDNLVKTLEKEQVYKEGAQIGANDAYRAVERTLMERIAAQQQPYTVAQNFAFVGQDDRSAVPAAATLTTPKSTEYEPGLAEAIAIQNNIKANAYARSLFKAESDGNMSEENINKLVEQELNRMRGAQ